MVEGCFILEVNISSPRLFSFLIKPSKFGLARELWPSENRRRKILCQREGVMFSLVNPHFQGLTGFEIFHMILMNSVKGQDDKQRFTTQGQCEGQQTWDVNQFWLIPEARLFLGYSPMCLSRAQPSLTHTQSRVWLPGPCLLKGTLCSLPEETLPFNKGPSHPFRVPTSATVPATLFYLRKFIKTKEPPQIL